MKKKRTVEVEVCDQCKTNAAYSPCIKCGATFCSDHRDTNGVTYRMGVFTHGYNDGFYCNKCHAVLLTKPDRRFELYRQIAQLSLEHTAFREDFNRRREAAEKELEKFYKSKK